MGVRIEAQKQLKKQIENQKQLEAAKPVLSSKTDEFAARYRAKQITKKTEAVRRRNSMEKQNNIEDSEQMIQGSEINTFDWLANQ